MAKISLDGAEIEVRDGAQLVEVIKQNGTFISNLCYVDGLPPYAGCRTCLVEIEGARGLQLACTSRVQEGMVVKTNTAQVLDARQAVLSIINANHSDRCLTCHRRVHCQPGDICLRDDTVTHRCLTCAKNYRCELQNTNEMLHMASYEPWLGEERTYYESNPPEADRANPFLEFDPQMCIICTRCVRVCDEVRHTGAITLAGRGFTTRIAFGAGGAIHESNCDFCGSCIDACPTATLLEKPN
ncbi:MAG: 2Fe-2S iron-sulfur cluster-binding protein, partial [Dehalococcoidia bacterium]